MKAILLICALALAYWYFRSKRGAPGRAAKPAAPERMVVCAYCGLHIPESESIRADSPDSLRYCCDEHRRLGTP